MEVRFTLEEEARLAQMARTAGTDAEELVKDAALPPLEEDQIFDRMRSGGQSARAV